MKECKYLGKNINSTENLEGYSAVYINKGRANLALPLLKINQY